MGSNVMLNWSILIPAAVIIILFTLYKGISILIEYRNMKTKMLPQLNMKMMTMSLSKGSFEEYLEILNHVVTTHCAETMRVVQLNGESSKDHIKELTVDITREIINSLSPEFKSLLLFYVTEKYLIQYISRLTREFVIRAIPEEEEKILKI